MSGYKREGYPEDLVAVASHARMLALVDVPAMLAMIERADAVGAVLDPTLYREKAAVMMIDKRLLEAALPLYRMGKELEARQIAEIEKKIRRGE